MDRIHIRDLGLRCVIGVYDDERREKQDIILNIVMAGDFSDAAKSDDIADAVNYKDIKKAVIQLVETSQFHLIETLADRVARICLQHPKVMEVTVTLDKPGALRFARSVAYEITRTRQERP